MQPKHVLAAALSVALLCVSGWASECELCCSLGRGCSGDWQAQELGAAASSALHSHCNHAGAARRHAAGGRGFENASDCHGASCLHLQTLASPPNGREAAPPKAARCAVVAAVPAAAPAALVGSAPHQRAALKLLPLDPLSVHLRI